MRLAVAVLACVGLSGCVYYLNPLCTDLIYNGDETDVDCGGTCGPCAIGDRCASSGDCDQGTCEAGRCVALPCGNGVKDGQETDVDCGGDTCRKCAGGRTCEVASDCFSGTCVAITRTCAALATVSFAEAVPYPSGDTAYALSAGDLDGDTDLDLAAVNEEDSTVSVFLNDGAGVLTRSGPFPTGAGPVGVEIADLDADGVADVVTADYRGGSVSVLLGTGMGVLAAKESYSGGQASDLAVGDLNGDGNLDVIAATALSSSVRVFLGRPDGTLEDAIDVPVGITGAARPSSVAVGDFDRDGAADVAIADIQSRTIVVRRGNGDATFGLEAPYLEGGLPPYRLVTGDMDLDGNLDLVCANGGSDDVSVLVGRGDGSFRRAIVSSTGRQTGPYGIAVADFNRDGVPDVVTANSLTGTASVLLGIGNGALEEPIDAGATGMTSYGVTAGDFNGDGRPDFVTANAGSDDVTVRLSTAR